MSLHRRVLSCVGTLHSRLSLRGQRQRSIVCPRRLSTSPNQCCVVSVPQSVTDKLICRFQALTVSPYTHYNDDATVKLIEGIVLDVIPTNIANVIRQTITMAPALLLTGCPVSPDPGPTPVVDRHPGNTAFVEEWFLLSLSVIRSTRLYHATNFKHNEVFSQVLAAKGFEGTSTSRGTAEMTLHTDQSSRPQSVDFISLSCVRSDANARTALLTVNEFIAGLPQWVISAMQENDFLFYPTSLDTGECQPLNKPILETVRPNDYRLRFHSNFESQLLAANRNGQRCLDYLKEHMHVVRARQQWIALERGHVLTLNNRRMLHGRSGYESSTAADHARWLKRSYEYFE